MELQVQESCDSAKSTSDCYRTSLLSAIELFTALQQRKRLMWSFLSLDPLSRRLWQFNRYLHLLQKLCPFLLVYSLVYSVQSLHPPPDGFRIRTDNTAISSHLGLLMLNVR